ncbi:MAG: mechanosensitive ion channel family protein [Planctomycetes bacterium]|nr:mechanosensitive ion channel family protein [Planctomycetota bacterium]
MSEPIPAQPVDATVQITWELVLTWGVPAAWIFGGILIGLVVERVVLRRLKAWSEKSGWGYDSILIGGVKGVAFFWCLMLGVFFGGQSVGLKAEWQAMVSNALVVALMFSLTVAVARVIGGLLAQSAKRSGGAVASSIITNLVAAVIYILGFLVILDTLGVQVTPVLTALGVGGLAVALALKDTLENLFAGLHLVASKQIHIGDFVRLDSGDEGVVSDLTWRSTTIRTLPGNIIIVPNFKLSSAIVTNFTTPSPSQPVAIPVGVAYGSDLEMVERVAIEVATDIQTSVDGGVRDFKPVVRFFQFADSSVNFNVVLRASKFQDQFLMRHELIKRLHARFNAEGIEIPFPIRTVHLKGALPKPT